MPQDPEDRGRILQLSHFTLEGKSELLETRVLFLNDSQLPCRLLGSYSLTLTDPPPPPVLSHGQHLEKQQKGTE